MGHTLDLPEIDILMDIAFLFQSVRDIKVMSQRFLQLLGKLIPYEKAVVLLYQEDQRSYAPCAEVRCGGAMLRDYLTTYSRLDYLGWRLFQSEEKVFLESASIRPEERQQARFYQDFLCRWGIEYRLVLNARDSAGAPLGAVMLFRSRILADFSEKEVAILERLHDHFSAGIENAIHFHSLKSQADLARRVYASIPDVMVILDGDLTVREGNESAEQFLLQLSAEPTRQRAFFRTIRNRCQEMREDGELAEDGSDMPDTRQVPLLDGTAKISMIVHPDVQGARAYEFIVIFSPDRPSRPGGADPPARAADQIQQRFFQTLRRQYGLTNREMDLVRLALDGLDNQKIAETLHISLFTVKSHFQNGYAKLGVKSRQDLFLTYVRYLISEPFRESFDAQTRKDDHIW